MVNWASNPVRGYQPDTDPGDEQPPKGGYTPEPPINQAYQPYPFNMPTQEDIQELIKALRENTDATRDMFDWLKGHELEDKDADA